MDLLKEGQISNRKTTIMTAYKFLYQADSLTGDVKSEINWLTK
ncbi:hypothetical protein [Rhodoflexus sp.]